MKLLDNIIVKKLLNVFNDTKSRYALISIFLLIILSTILLAFNKTGKTYDYNVGDIALEDIRVSNDIHYIKEDETERQKKRTLEAVPIVFDRDASILTERLQIVDALFDNIILTMDQYPPLGNDDMLFQLMTLKNRLPKYLIYNDSILLAFLSYDNSVELKRIVSRITIHIYDNKDFNLVKVPYTNPLSIENKNITIRIINNDNVDSDEISGTLDNLITVDEIKKRVYAISSSISGNIPRRTVDAIAVFISSILKPDTSINEEETKRRIGEAENTSKPVMGVLKKGQTILREGDTVTVELLERIQLINKNATTSNITFIAGIFLIQMIFFFIFIIFMIGPKRLVIPDKKFSVIVFSLLSTFFAYAYFFSESDIILRNDMDFTFMMPIVMVSMVLSVLCSLHLAMLMGLFAAFFVFAIHGGDFNTIVLSVTSATLGVFINWDVQKRANFLAGGLYIGLINAIVVISLSLMQEIPMSIVFKSVQLAVASGFVNAVLALGLLPLFENVFGITTTFKLLELSDLNSDIFRRMLVEAPGTYHHSLLVSNMAEAACRNIHADPLLARVGAYYHDVGKIESPGIYIENRVTDPRAKSYSPLEYSHKIISHVTDGIELARKIRLPESVIDFIREHHGQSTMTFFYHKALEAVTSDAQDVHKSDFQYPGPKPQTRESAVVMLADSVEAASRSILEPTPNKLRGLVRKIIYNKLNEGEFEDTDLSMADLKSIEESFEVILNGIYHTRIEYPETDDVKQLEKKLKQNGFNESD